MNRIKIQRIIYFASLKIKEAISSEDVEMWQDIKEVAEYALKEKK